MLASYGEDTALVTGAALSLGRRGALLLAWHTCRTEVAVVVGVAMGAGAGVVNGFSQGSLCGIESSLAPRAES